MAALEEEVVEEVLAEAAASAAPEPEPEEAFDTQVRCQPYQGPRALCERCGS